MYGHVMRVDESSLAMIVLKSEVVGKRSKVWAKQRWFERMTEKNSELHFFEPNLLLKGTKANQREKKHFLNLLLIATCRNLNDF